MSDEVTERVIKVVADSRKVSREQISLDTTFEELGMDSLDGISLIFDLEEEFNVAIPNDEAVKIHSVRQTVENLKRLLAAPGDADAGTVPAN